MNKNFVTVLAVIVLLLCAIFLTGCSTSAETVSYNISREADEFKVKRRIVFINLRSDTYLFSITGNCSIETDNADNQLEVICRIGDDKYQKHFLRLSNETTYTVEQLEYSDVSRYDYEIVFRPEAIIPIEIKTQVGEN
ncbi:hypothetical protein IJE86_01405 [bacterium]|nr:hypothetical protein [bacterium]